MIVPMKKVSIAVYEKDCKNSLKKLRDAGVLHIDKKNVSSETLTKLVDRNVKVKKALAILARYQTKKDEYPQYMPTSDKDLVSHIIGLMDEKKTLQDQLIYNVRERKRVEAWGDFDINQLSYLEKNGIVLFPYEITRKAYDVLKTDIKMIILNEDKLKVRAFSVDEKLPGITPFIFSPQSISRIDERVKYIRKRIEEIESDLTNLTHRDKAILDEDSQIPDDIEFEVTRSNMEKWGDVPSVYWLTGYVPDEKDTFDVLKKLASENGWALVIKELEPTDRPPTYIRNNKAVSIIKPIFSFLGTVPGYKEIDISSPFLVFFSLYVAMILGDAAYGFLVLGLGIFLAVTSKKKTGNVPEMAKLLIVLACCTIVWGAINGSWFALKEEKLPFFLTMLIIPPFRGDEPIRAFPFLQSLFNLKEPIPAKDAIKWNIQFLCFSIALIQILYARVTCFVRRFPSLTAYSELGWIFMMFGLYFLVLNMLLKIDLPPFVIWFIGIGISCNFIFSEQNGGNFFKNLLKSFSNFISIFLKAVSAFADIISYIRLFAVGLAGANIAITFNELAGVYKDFGSFGLVFVIRLLAAILLLALGHGLNLLMGALSVIVHGVRLNLLEFAGNHLGMEWSGYSYKPFAVRQKQ